MTYSYDSLEQVLELAAYRLPPKMLGRLIERTEEVILTREDSTALESEIFKIIQEHNTNSKFFSLKKLNAGANSNRPETFERKLFSMKSLSKDEAEAAA